MKCGNGGSLFIGRIRPPNSPVQTDGGLGFGGRVCPVSGFGLTGGVGETTMGNRWWLVAQIGRKSRETSVADMFDGRARVNRSGSCGLGLSVKRQFLSLWVSVFALVSSLFVHFPQSLYIWDCFLLLNNKQQIIFTDSELLKSL